MTAESTLGWVRAKLSKKNKKEPSENNLANLKSPTGAQTLVESNVFVDIKDPLTSQYSEEEGYAVDNDNDFGSGSNSAPAGTLTSVPYEYSLLGSDKVKAAVVGKAGQTLTLG